MSIRVTAAIWDHSKAKLGDRLVLLYIADRCNDDGAGAYPSVATIASHCQLSDRSVQLALKRLVQIGELEVEYGAGPRGVNRFTVLPGGRRICTPEDSSGVKSWQGGVKNTAPRGEESSPNTSVNTSIEPTKGLPTGDEPRAASIPTPAKPRTPAQKAADDLFDRRRVIVDAYFDGVRVNPDSIGAKQRFGQAMKTLTPAVLDSPECGPDTIRDVARYAAAAYRWRDGNATPSLAEVLKAFPEWDAAGRPEQPPSRRANGHAPPNGNGPGHRPKYNAQGQRVYTLADLRENERHDHESDSDAVVEAASRLASD